MECVQNLPVCLALLGAPRTVASQPNGFAESLVSGHGLKATGNQPCTVKHRRHVIEPHARVAGHFGHARVSGGLVGPLHPGHHDGVVRPGARRLEEVAVGAGIEADVIAVVGGGVWSRFVEPALGHPGGAVFADHLGRDGGHVLVAGLVGAGARGRDSSRCGPCSPHFVVRWLGGCEPDRCCPHAHPGERE